MVEDSRTPARAHRLRPLNLPRPVMVDATEDGTPVSLRVDGRVLAVAVIRERWRIDDEWWRQPIVREYLDIVLEDGTRVVLYHDLETGAWYTQRA